MTTRRHCVEHGRAGLRALLVVACLAAAALVALSLHPVSWWAGPARRPPGGLAQPASPTRPASTARPAPPRHRPVPKGLSSQRSSAPVTSAITAAVRADADGIVRVTGVAAACSVEQEGSGFVVSTEHVVTNAHVVQGLRFPRVQVAGVGGRYRARVVLYDPGVDLAVLDVPGLPARPLPVEKDGVRRGSLAVVAGFPLNGPLTLSPGRVQAEALDAGPQVGITKPRPRPVYQLSAAVKPGNSGGPLLAPDGDVVGVVFARSTRGPRSGFAIVSSAVLGVVAKAVDATTPVSTGRCS